MAPTLPWSPGWGLGACALSRLAQALAPHFTVNCIDLPGYGDSTAINATDHRSRGRCSGITSTPCRRAQCCADGRSARMICLVCAARHPRLVARMVLVGATASFVVREGWPEAMPVAQARRISQRTEKRQRAVASSALPP